MNLRRGRPKLDLPFIDLLLGLDVCCWRRR